MVYNGWTLLRMVDFFNFEPFLYGALLTVKDHTFYHTELQADWAGQWLGLLEHRSDMTCLTSEKGQVLTCPNHAHSKRNEKNTTRKWRNKWNENDKQSMLWWFEIFHDGSHHFSAKIGTVRGKVGLSQSLVSSQKFHTKDSPVFLGSRWSWQKYKNGTASLATVEIALFMPCHAPQIAKTSTQTPCKLFELWNILEHAVGRFVFVQPVYVRIVPHSWKHFLSVNNNH